MSTLNIVPADFYTSFLPLTLLETRWKYVLLSCGFWGVLYNLFTRLFSMPDFLPYKHKPEVTKYDISLLKSECVSLVHSAVASLLSIGSLVSGFSQVAKEPVWGYDEASCFILTLTTGYLLYDTLWLLSHFKKGDGQFMVHHLVTLALYGYACMKPFIHFEGLIFLTWEASTPFLNLRKLLIAYDLTTKFPQQCAVNDVLFVVSFFMSRIFFGWYFSYFFWMKFFINFDPKVLVVPFAARYMYLMANCILNGLNTYWFLKIIARSFRGGNNQKKTTKRKSLIAKSS
eukprot:TRINITY_DN50679_c0_g1_i2.p1 TRINITY_DN50679_c0_g1~~TRINITY_DN50679_c0_g1_i2.p1  ORF type:complete len:286 (+),score=74.46 TRINITY_DN50679_c0_g1_i2:269-1126(+)